MEIKQNILNFQDLKKAVNSKNCISKKTFIPILVLNALVYIFKMKKKCKKKSLNKLLLATDSFNTCLLTNLFFCRK